MHQQLFVLLLVLWLYCQGWCVLLCGCQQTTVASNLVAGVKYGQKMYIFLCKPTWLSPFVSKHKVEQEADDTEDDPHCCQKVEDHYQPKLKGVNDFLWSAIWGYPVCSNTIFFCYYMNIHTELVSLHRSLCWNDTCQEFITERVCNSHIWFLYPPSG